MSAPVYTKVVLIRHGESVSNAARTFGGPRSCTGLSDNGRTQVELLAKRLERTGELDGTVLYASGFARAIETAKLVAPAVGDPGIVVDERFGELDPGPECDGMLWDDIVTEHAPNWDDEDPETVLFPGGETVGALNRRVTAAIEQVVREHAGGTVTVCAHGGVVDAAMRMAIGLPPRGWIDLYAAHASLTVLTDTSFGRWRVDRYNDHAHLLDGFFG